MPGARSFRATAQPIPNAVWTDIVASGTRYDDEAMWAAGNPSRLTTTASGLHIVTANLSTAANATGARLYRLLSSAARYEAICGQAPEAGIECSASLASLVNAAAGDYFTAGIFQNSGAALNTATAGAPYAADLSITRLVAGTIGIRRESSVAQSIPNGVTTVLTFDTSAFDIGIGGVSADRLVAPVDGTYIIFAGAYMPAASGSVSAQYLSILLDGAVLGLSLPGTSTGSITGWSACATWPLVAGGYVQAAITQFSGAARLTDVAVLRPYLAMARIGP